MGQHEAPQTADSTGSPPQRCNSTLPPRCNSTLPQQSDTSASSSIALDTNRPPSTPADSSASSSATSPTAALQRAATLPQILVEQPKQEPRDDHVDVMGQQKPSGSSTIRPAADTPSSSSSSALFQPMKTFLDFLQLPYDAKPADVEQQPKTGASAPTPLQFMPSPVGAAVSALRRRPSPADAPPTLTPHRFHSPATPSPPNKRGKVDFHSIASMFQSTSWTPSPSTSSDDVATGYEHFNPYAMNPAGMYGWSPPMGQFGPPLAAYDGSPNSYMGQATPSPSSSSQAYAHPPQVNVSPYNANWTHASSSGGPSPTTPARPTTFMPLVEQRLYERCAAAARREQRIEETIDEVIAKVMAGWVPPYGEFDVVPPQPQNDAQALAEALQQHQNTYRPLAPSQIPPHFGGLPGMPFFPQFPPMGMFHPQQQQPPPPNFLSMLPPNFGQLQPMAFRQGLMQQTAAQQQALVKRESTSQEGTQYCRWSPCSKAFSTSHELYHHVLNEHFLKQRSQDQGLLACYWQQCPLKMQFFPVPEAHAHVKEHVPVPEGVRPS